jgi:DNA-binding NarL/FixJ family response regulator
MHKHHIVFRSQGGLDIDLNLMELTYEQHEGPEGPHHNKLIDRILKKDLQEKLFDIFWKEGYTIEEIAKLLGKSKKYIEKHFRKVPSAAGIYTPEEIIKKLMGGKFY